MPIPSDLGNVANCDRCTPCATAIILRSVPTEQVTMALGVYHLGIYLGAGIGFGLGGATVKDAGWRGIFNIFGGEPSLGSGSIV